MCVYCNIRRSAINRHRRRLFGDQALTVYGMTPAAGETLIGTFTIDWRARRIEATTNEVAVEAGAWQFTIVAADDWETTQAFMLKAAAFRVGTRRWKVKKIEKPVDPHSRVWKVKAEIQ